MESVGINEVRKAIQKYNDNLRADDPRFRREVTLIHEDGTYQHIDSAFLMRYDICIICFAEHHEVQIHYADDLLLYWESERRHEPLEELP